MRTFHREKHDWGFRDFYFQYDSTIEYVERRSIYIVHKRGRIEEFEHINDARAFVKGKD